MFSKQLNEKLDKYHLLKHPFYKSWNEGKLNKVENQIFLLEKQLALNESDVKVLENLSDIYSENRNFKEQLNILSIWLKVEPENQKAIGGIRSLFFESRSIYALARHSYLRHPQNTTSRDCRSRNCRRVERGDRQTK